MGKITEWVGSLSELFREKSGYVACMRKMGKAYTFDRKS
jgi:hypothetical protein